MNDNEHASVKQVIGCLSDRLMTTLAEGLVLHGIDPETPEGDVIAQYALEAALAVHCRGAGTAVAGVN